MANQPNAPQIVSNEIEDFQQGGIYPGGSGFVKQALYQLWDYDGKQPKDSVCAAHIVLTPLDGSNDGKDVDIFFSVGSSSDFVPDNTGGNILSLTGRQQSNASNWGHFLSVLRNGCGLEKGKLSGPTGIRVMEQGYMTVTRVDQPHRDFADVPTDDKKKGARKLTMLVPTKATFSWDPNYKNAAASYRTARPGQAQGAIPAAPAQASAAPPVNGSGALPNNLGPIPTGDVSAANTVKAILARSGGTVSIAELPKLALGELATAERGVRLAIVKELKDPAGLEMLALENGWNIAGDSLTA